MSGNCAMGIWVSATRPAMVMTTDMTMASRGRSMKIPDSIAYVPDPASAACTTCPGRTL